MASKKFNLQTLVLLPLNFFHGGGVNLSSSKKYKLNLQNEAHTLDRFTRQQVSKEN